MPPVCFFISATGTRSSPLHNTCAHPRYIHYCFLPASLLTGTSHLGPPVQPQDDKESSRLPRDRKTGPIHVILTCAHRAGILVHCVPLGLKQSPLYLPLSSKVPAQPIPASRTPGFEPSSEFGRVGYRGG